MSAFYRNVVTVAALASLQAGAGASLAGVQDTAGAFIAAPKNAETVLAEVGRVSGGVANLDKWSGLAVGNNYTAAMVAALATGKPVYVPWRLVARDIDPAACALQDGQVILGSGPGSRLRLTSTGIMFNADGRTNAGLRHLWLEGPGVASNIANSYLECAWKAIGPTRCVVSDCVMSGWAGAAVFNQDALRCRVERNHFTAAMAMPLPGDAFGSADIVFWGSSVANKVDGNESDSGSSYGVILQTVLGATQQAYRNHITRNTIVGSLVYGVMVYNITAAHIIQDTYIAGNTIRDVVGRYYNPAGLPSFQKDFGCGIYILQAERTTVAHNTIKNVCIDTDNTRLTPAAIGMNGVSKALIEGNDIDGSAFYGIMVVDTLQLGLGTGAGSTAFRPAGFVTVRGNNIQRTVKHAIWIKDHHNVTCEGNCIDEVTGAGQSGILLETSTANYPKLKRIKVNGNNITNVTGSGILTYPLVGATINGNTIDTVGATGMHLDTVDSVVSANSLTACAVKGIDLRPTGSRTALHGNRVTSSGVGLTGGHDYVGENLIEGNVTLDYALNTSLAGAYALKAAAMPAFGTWVRGRYVENTVPAFDANSMTVQGWRRLTSGSAHVAGVDWAVVRTSHVSPAL